MTKHFKFTSSESSFTESGFKRSAVDEIFLWKPIESQEPIELLPGTPEGARAYILREQQACNTFVDAINARNFWIPDPWTGVPLRPVFVASASKQGQLPYDILPIFYRFASTTGNTFWLINFSTEGRLTQAYFPSLDLALYDINHENSIAVVESLKELIQTDPDVSTNFSKMDRVVGLVDQINNFGHQLINHLSGLQRTVDLSVADKIDEIWVVGPEFFGSIGSLFPEFENRIRRLDRWDVANAIRQSEILPLRLGATIFTKTLRDRITNQSSVSVIDPKPKRSPLLAITIRGNGRRCINLPEIIPQLVHRLLPVFPYLGVILDGFVLPESSLVAKSSIATILGTGYETPIRVELALASEISTQLPPNVLVSNLIGRSMLESIQALKHIDAYLAHIGTLQHKLGFMTDAGGVVHGPKEQLQNIQSGPFQTETGTLPHFIFPDAIEDVPTDTARGSGFFDYRIVNLDEIAKALERVLQSSIVGRTR